MKSLIDSWHNWNQSCRKRSSANGSGGDDDDAHQASSMPGFPFAPPANRAAAPAPAPAAASAAAAPLPVPAPAPVPMPVPVAAYTTGTSRSLPKQGPERQLLVSFVEVAERAKRCQMQGHLREAQALFSEALVRGRRLAHIKEVQIALEMCHSRLAEVAQLQPGARTTSHGPQVPVPPSAAPTPPPAPPVAAAAVAAENELEAAILELRIKDGDGGSVSWDDVTGLEGPKQKLWEAAILPILNPAIFTGLREPTRGILFYGPPGNGKTFLAKAAASTCKSAFFSISASGLTSKWHGESEKMVKALFKVARSHAPSIIFLDEVDSVLSARSSSESEAGRRLKTEFLVQMDGLTAREKEKEKAGLLLLAATNRPFDLDDAVLRRFPVQIHIPLPDGRAREKMLLASLTKVKSRLSPTDIAAIARRTERFSSSDLQNLAREAAMVAIRELPPAEVANLASERIRPIVYNDFLVALEYVNASCSAKTEKELSDWSNQRRR